jgi:HAMP domain-containing protein
VSIATRVTLLTVLLVTLALGVYGSLSMRGRRAERTADLERQTWLFGSALKVALEAAVQDGLYEDLHRLIDRMQVAERNIEVAYLDLMQPAEDAVFAPSSQGGKSSGDKPFRPPSPDAGREERRRRVEITRQPYGEHLYISGREVYAYTLPIVDSKHRMVAIIDLVRDKSALEQEMLRATRDVVLTLGGLALLLAILVSLTVRQEFSAPLLRLVGGIDEVTRGDYTGAILRERNDEVGLLADRFNEMTGSLRDARNEILAGVDAKLQLSSGCGTRTSWRQSVSWPPTSRTKSAPRSTSSVVVLASWPVAPKILPLSKKTPTSSPPRPSGLPRSSSSCSTTPGAKPRRAADVDLRRVCASTLDFLEVQLTTRHVVAQLHPFAVPTPPQPESHIEAMVRGEALVGELKPPAAPIVTGDADQLQQVCLNLVHKCDSSDARRWLARPVTWKASFVASRVSTKRRRART